MTPLTLQIKKTYSQPLSPKLNRLTMLITLFLLLYLVISSGYLFAFENPVRIMPLGDSLTYDNYISENRPHELRTAYRQSLWLQLINAGYNVDFVGSQVAGEFALPSFDPDNEGHPGWTASDIAAVVYQLLYQNPADIVLLHVGTNELDTSADDVEVILNEIDLYETDFETNVTVILARIINRSQYSLDTTQFNDNVVSLAQTRIDNGDDIIIVDMEDGADIDYRLSPEGDMQDNLHPTIDGYNKMAAVWFAAIDSLLPLAQPYAPLIFTQPRVTAYLGFQYIYNLSATGNPQPVYDLILGPENASLDLIDGELSWIPDSFGTYDFSLQASNLEGNDIQDISVTVIDPDFIWLEAESGTITGPMEAVQDASASGGIYVLVNRGSGGELEYTFQVAETGDYVVWARVIARNSSTDSFFIRMDNGDEQIWDMQRSEDWVWDRVSDRNGSDPSIFNLDAGLHTLIISKRETGARIDRILITRDLAYQPSGTGSDTRTLSMAISGAGSVLKNPDQTAYNLGDPVEITAIPANGWQFDGWSGDLTGSQNPATIVMNDNKTITANFSQIAPPDQYQLTLQASGSGSVSANPTGPIYNDGTSVVIEAVPQAGWQFDGWSGDLTGSQNPATIVMDDNKTITANFSQTAPDQYQLTLQASGSGSVSANPTGPIYNDGTSVVIEAIPQAGWQFDGWSGDLTGSQNPATIVMDANKTITALFSNTGTQPGLLWLEAESGTITGPMEAVQDTSASSGVYILVNRGSGGELEYTFQVAEAGDYVVWARVIARNSSTDSFFIRMDNGDEQIWDMQRSEDWVWDRVSARNGSDPSIFNLDAGLHTLIISKRETGARIDRILITRDLAYQPSGTGSDTRTLSMAISGAGSVLKNPDQTAYNLGDPVEITAIPSNGWQFDGWSGDLTGSQNPATIVMNDNKTITANFSQIAPPDQYQLTLQTSGSGSVSANPTGPIYNDGTSVVIEAIPQAGWQFDGWSGDLTGSQNPATIVMDDNKTITALFSITGTQPGLLWLEAESGTITGPMEAVQDTSASGGVYILVNRGSGGELEYTFQVAEAGDYVVWARVIARNSSTDSFFIRMDNGDEQIWDMQRSEDWVWDRVSARNGSDPSIFNLDAGLHTLIISKRETGARIDRILITNDLSYLP